jgi:hypothetical protein
LAQITYAARSFKQDSFHLLLVRSVAALQVTYSAAMAKLALLVHRVNKDLRVPMA